MNHLLVSTRTGLITYTQESATWSQTNLSFLGIPVCLSKYDATTNTLWAFLDHGHWGVKIQRSEDFGKTWEGVPEMTYPEGSVLRYRVSACSGKARR